MRNSHIAHLVSSNKELSDTLQQRNQLIIAYQNQANAIERRNRELESKVRELESKLSHFKSTPGGKRKVDGSTEASILVCYICFNTFCIQHFKFNIYTLPHL